MNYTIKCKDGLDGLFSFLKKNKFKPALVDEHELVVEVNEQKRELFETVTSVFVSYIGFIRFVRDFLNAENVSEDDAVFFFDEAIQAYNQSTYWKGLTYMVLSDFLKTKQVLNVDSFLLFNLKGFKTEVISFIRNMMKSVAEEDDEGDEEQEIEAENGIQIINSSVLFQQVREHLKRMKFDESEFKKIDVIQVDKRLQLKGVSGVLIDKSYLNHRLKEILDMDISGDGDLIYEDILLLTTICHLISVESIVIHNVTAEIKIVLEEAFSRLSKDGRNFEMRYCKGCSKCDE